MRGLNSAGVSEKSGSYPVQKITASTESLLPSVNSTVSPSMNWRTPWTDVMVPAARLEIKLSEMTGWWFASEGAGLRRQEGSGAGKDCVE